MEKDEVIKHLNQRVAYASGVYKLIGYYAWRDEATNKLCHSLVLLDKNENSTIQVPIEKVEVFSNEKL